MIKDWRVLNEIRSNIALLSASCLQCSKIGGYEFYFQSKVHKEVVETYAMLCLLCLSTGVLRMKF